LVYAQSVTAESSAHLDRRLAYIVFRLSLGINLLTHGAGRILGPGADAFSTNVHFLYLNPFTLLERGF
jgi:hypothetical protein